jgi:hypothetical protein
LLCLLWLLVVSIARFHHVIVLALPKGCLGNHFWTATIDCTSHENKLHNVIALGHLIVQGFHTPNNRPLTLEVLELSVARLGPEVLELSVARLGLEVLELSVVRLGLEVLELSVVQLGLEVLELSVVRLGLVVFAKSWRCWAAVGCCGLLCLLVLQHVV